MGFVGYPNVGKSSVINTLRTKNVIPFLYAMVVLLSGCNLLVLDCYDELNANKMTE